MSFEDPNLPRQTVDQLAFARHNKGKSYDAELFDEVTKDLAAQYEAAGPELQKDILVKRFFDASGQLSSDGKSEFTKESALTVPEFAQSELSKAGIVQWGNIAEKYLGLTNVQEDVPRVFQYGPSRVYQVPAGTFIEVARMDSQDVMGTNLLTSCTAVILKEQEKVFLAHVRMSDPDVVEKILKDNKYSQGILVTPERKTGAPLDEEINKRVTKRVASFANLGIVRYPYIVSGMQNNPHDVHSTSVVVGDSFVRTVGVSEKFGLGTPGRKHLYFDQKPESVRDESF